MDWPSALSNCSSMKLLTLSELKKFRIRKKVEEEVWSVSITGGHPLGLKTTSYIKLSTKLVSNYDDVELQRD